MPEKPTETPVEETEAAANEVGESKPAATLSRGPAASPLTRASDKAARPGFRSPANRRSKATRKKRKRR